MAYKIQSKTIFGWMDVMGDFDSIQEAQERIPMLQDNLKNFNECYQINGTLKIVDMNELGINHSYVYKK
jgi:hypothetical protein